MSAPRVCAVVLLHEDGRTAGNVTSRPVRHVPGRGLVHLYEGSSSTRRRTFMSVTRADQRGSAGPLVAAQVSRLGRLGSWSYRHRRFVAVAWVVVLVVISLAGRLAGPQFQDD